MKVMSFVGGTIGAFLALSQVAYAESTGRVACLPMNGQQQKAYWQFCPVDKTDPTKAHSCGCKDGFVALDMFQIQNDNTTASGKKVTPVSASPG